MFAADSHIKCQKDHEKYEIARELKTKIDHIRGDYEKNLKSNIMVDRQKATALYFIDKLAGQSQNINQNCPTSGFEMCVAIGSRHLWCRVPTTPTKTRLESRFCYKEVYTTFYLWLPFSRPCVPVARRTQKRKQIRWAAATSAFSTSSWWATKHTPKSSLTSWVRTVSGMWILAILTRRPLHRAPAILTECLKQYGTPAC